MNEITPIDPPADSPGTSLADSPDRFINRELSWLDFNHRVVEEAQNTRHPLLERLRFVSISASNLDEFYSVRVAGLIGQAKAGVASLSADGRTAAQQLGEIQVRAAALMTMQQTHLARAARPAGRGRHRGVRPVPPAGRRQRLAGRLVHGPGVPHPDAAGHPTRRIRSRSSRTWASSW